MKVLSIGNSFSQDAHHYLHSLAKSDGVNLKVVNLFIGGCSLRTHYLNMLDDMATYSFEFNGENTGIKVSIRQALISDDWDIITLQQASQFSWDSETYYPYIEELSKYVKKYCPKTKIVLHETWAYENGSERIKNLGLTNAEEMYSKLHTAYMQAAEKINAVGIIPCGTAMFKAAKLGIKVHRDQFHASLGFGRYLLALTWYAFLTGKDISENDFNELEEPLLENERKIAVQIVSEVVYSVENLKE